MPSLHQLNDAIASYRADHPDVLMTVVVDATFGHRIDPKEVPEFEKEIETNAFVAPPAGAVGRGDGFILSIAQKANASILSNDSYQEFHGEYAWLFDEGRLIGGKPVPHVGWVWVNRVPVRGPVSRRSVKEQKIVDKSPSRRRGSKSSDIPSISADAPMPVPTSLPPGAVMPGQKPRPGRGPDAVETEATKGSGRRGGSRRGDQATTEPARAEAAKDHAATAAAARQDQGRTDPSKTTNDLLAFLSFVEHFPVGTAVTGVVETYSSHGAYVLIGDAHGYVPLRLMADPAPRSAREVMDLGETVTLVVSSFGAARRSIDLAVPSMAPAAAPAAPDKPRRGTTKKAAAAAVAAAVAAAAMQAASDELSPVSAPVGSPVKPKRRSTKQAVVHEAAPATFDTAFADEPMTTPVAAPVVAEPTPAKATAKKASRGAKAGAKRRATPTPVPAPPASIAAQVPVAVQPGPVTPPERSSKTVASAAKRAPRPAEPAKPAKAGAPKSAAAAATAPTIDTPTAPGDVAKPAPARKQAAPRRRPAKSAAKASPESA